MHTGPRNIINGLVFGYDTGDDSRYYPGEPTTNILPSPQNNGRFTTSNGWSSYNTNQYCGNNGCAQYWTIPSISSVSSNIVTTSSPHQIRSFDVIRSNSSGGGISAGTDYVAKKISDTQFSLHAYNGSQNGSQGYINPDTGFFKVHDAFATDTRVYVTASGFPTGWWGAPHLPNSGLIKEVVTGGGRVPGTNCMRLHAYRTDDVVDGMAYGVDTPVSAGQVVTFSLWHKAGSPGSIGKSCGWSSYFGGYGAPSGGFTMSENWQRYSLTFTASVSYSFILYFWPPAQSRVDLADMQVEIKDHATPFTVSSRSSTNALLDMTNVNTINVSNASFNSLGRPYFDGTNDSIIVSNHSSLKNNTTSIELVVKYNSAPVGDIIQFGVGSGSYAQYYYRAYGGNSYWNWFPTNTSAYGAITIPNSAFTTGTYYHVVMIGRSDGSVSFYINGVAQSGATLTGTSAVSTWTPANLTIGGFTWDGYSSSEIPVVKIYNRELSSIEIGQHYQSYKTRFSIS